MDPSNLSIMCWNARGVMSGAPYLSSCLSENNIDICAIADHQLRAYNMCFLDSIDSKYSSICSPAPDPDPYVRRRFPTGGTALLYRKELSGMVEEINLDCNRICGMEILSGDNEAVYIFAVYMYLPTSNRSDDLYNDYIQRLRDIYLAYSERGHVILLGDFNATIRKFPGSNNARDNMLSALVRAFSLCPANSLPIRSGPRFTFHAYDGGPQAELDYILIPEELSGLITRVEVKDDHSFNVSDHHPVLTSIAYSVYATSGPDVIYQPHQRPAFEKAVQQDLISGYEMCLALYLGEVESPVTDCTPEEVQNFYNHIVQSISAASSRCIPHKRYRKFLKPYWKGVVKAAHGVMGRTRQAWISDGRPRGMEHPTFKRYKEAKDQFRYAMKEEAARFESDHFSSLDSYADIDQRLFWTLLRGKKKRPISCLKSGQTEVRGEGLCDVMADHLKRICGDEVEPHFDLDFQRRVESSVEEIRSNNEHSIKEHVWTSGEEVLKTLKSLKNNKSSGIDNICYEHLRYGGQRLALYIAELFNLILSSGYIPKQWKLGLIIPIHKGGNKPRTSPDSYRGVSLLPVLFKVFEMLLARRIPEITDSKTFPNEQQQGFQKGLSSCHTSFVLQETISHYLERGDSLNVAFLDSTKAFDTVWHRGLLYKLHEAGVTGGLWNIFHNMYDSLRSSVLINGATSYWFPVMRGVRQGSVLSAKLYLLYIDGLLDRLRDSKRGAVVLDLHIPAPTQADDIALISPVTSNLQCMLNICELYSSEWRFTFSPSKSKLIKFTRSVPKPKEVLLYGRPLLVTDEIKHVGFILDAKWNSWERTLHSCSTLRALTMAMVKSGVHSQGLNPITCSKVLRSMFLPRALFGCELWCDMSCTELLALERAQRFAVKMVQGLPRFTRTDICNALLGWLPLEAYVDMRKLYFLGQLCNTPPRLLPKKMFVTRLAIFNQNQDCNQTGYIPDIYRLLRKYSLVEHLDSFASHRRFPKQHQWKQRVKKAVTSVQTCDWKHRVTSHTDTAHFLNIHDAIQPHSAWQVSKHLPRLKKAAHYLVKLCALWRPGYLPGTCRLCGAEFQDVLTHTVCQCQNNELFRDKMWCAIINIGPIDLSVNLHQMTDCDIISCLLSCKPPLEQTDSHLNLQFAETVLTELHNLEKLMTFSNRF